MAIIEEFKKGQLVPKRLGTLLIHKKARHLVKFGVDVKVTKCLNRTQVLFEPTTCGPLYVLPPVFYIKRPNKTKQKVGAMIRDTHLNNSNIKQQTSFYEIRPVTLTS